MLLPQLLPPPSLPPRLRRSLVGGTRRHQRQQRHRQGRRERQPLQLHALWRIRNHVRLSVPLLTPPISFAGVTPRAIVVRLRTTVAAAGGGGGAVPRCARSAADQAAARLRHAITGGEFAAAVTRPAPLLRAIRPWRRNPRKMPGRRGNLGVAPVADEAGVRRERARAAASAARHTVSRSWRECMCACAYQYGTGGVLRSTNAHHCRAARARTRAPQSTQFLAPALVHSSSARTHTHATRTGSVGQVARHRRHHCFRLPLRGRARISAAVVPGTARRQAAGRRSGGRAVRQGARVFAVRHSC